MLGGLILAAGGGSRFAAASPAEDATGATGAIKQLAPFRGRPLLQWALDAQCSVSEIDRVVVVLGAHYDTILDALNLGRAQAVVCVDWRLGLSASLKLGMRALPECERVIVTLGDQPLIDAATIRRFVEEPAGTRGAHAGQPGHPVVLGHQHRAAIETLTGDRGAAPILNDSRLIERGPASVLDVDLPADLAHPPGCSG
jgi:CTP:molybdopterin cytidylyltransferase MocA